MLFAHKFQLQKILTSVADHWPSLVEVDSLISLVDTISVKDEAANRDGYLRVAEHLSKLH